MENHEWKRVYASIIVAVFFTIICFIAINFIDGMEGGYAIAFVSFYIIICGIAVAALFFHRARVMDAILNSNQLLAHWIYSPDMAHESAYQEYADYQARNKALFFLIGGMLAAVAIFFILFIEEGGLETGIILFAIAVLLFIVSRITPKIQMKHALAAPHEAYIAQNGIIYEGAVYPFRSFMMNMNKVFLQKGTLKKNPALIFSFTQLVGLYIIQPFDIVVPIPAGQEDTAYRVVRSLGGPVQGEEK
jgi:hypothetical protein